jgi:DNA-binding MarR family transcriptional regulator
MIVTRRTTADEPNLVHLLGVPYELLVDELHARLAAAGFPDLRPPHAPVLAQLTADGMRLTELAQRARLTKQMLNYLVNALEESGYVERLDDPADRRGRLVRLTNRGLDASRASRAIARQIEHEWATQIGESEMRYLRLLLRKLGSTLGSRVQPEGGPDE